MRLQLAVLAMYLAGPVPAVEPEPNCTTVCGLEAHLTWESCQELQLAEWLVIRTLSEEVSAYRVMCPALRGWHLKVHSRVESADSLCDYPGWWAPKAASCVQGYTHYADRTVEVADYEFSTNALVHELSHVFDVANGRPAGHCDWAKVGVKRAIWRVRGAEDPSPDVCPPDYKR